MRMGTPRRLVIGLVAGMLLSATAARAQEEKCLRPELEQLLQTVAEKFQEAADKLGLSDDQRAKIREIHAKHVEEYKTLRTERRELPRPPPEGNPAVRRAVFRLDSGEGCVRSCGHPSAVNADLVLTALRLAGRWAAGSDAPPWLLASGGLPLTTGSQPRSTDRQAESQTTGCRIWDIALALFSEVQSNDFATFRGLGVESNRGQGMVRRRRHAASVFRPAACAGRARPRSAGRHGN